MAWNSSHVVVFRASTVNDPEDTTAAGYVEVELGMVLFDAWPDLLGDDEADGAGNLSSNFGAREAIDYETVPFAKSTALATGDLMDGGRIRKFLLEVCTSPFIWIWRVYAVGTSTNTPLPRATYDAATLTSTTSTDSFWNLSSVDYQQASETYPYSPAGQCPMRVVIPPQRPEYLGEGVSQLRGTMFKASEESV